MPIRHTHTESIVRASGFPIELHNGRTCDLLDEPRKPRVSTDDPEDGGGDGEGADSDGGIVELG